MFSLLAKSLAPALGTQAGCRAVSSPHAAGSRICTEMRAAFASVSRVEFNTPWVLNSYTLTSQSQVIRDNIVICKHTRPYQIHYANTFYFQSRQEMDQSSKKKKVYSSLLFYTIQHKGCQLSLIFFPLPK